MHPHQLTPWSVPADCHLAVPDLGSPQARSYPGAFPRRPDQQTTPGPVLCPCLPSTRAHPSPSKTGLYEPYLLWQWRLVRQSPGAKTHTARTPHGQILNTQLAPEGVRFNPSGDSQAVQKITGLLLVRETPWFLLAPICSRTSLNLQTPMFQATASTTSIISIVANQF